MRWLCIVLILITPLPAPAVVLLSPDAPSPGRGLWFDIPSSIRMLQEIEGCRARQGALATCKELLSNEEMMVDVQNRRIKELENDIEALEEMNRNALDAAKEVSGRKWYESVLSAGKWIVLGALVGFAIGASQ